MSDILWQPSAERIADANLTAFRHSIEQQHGVALADYPALYQWSIDHPELFWRTLWRFAGVIGEPGQDVLIDGDRMPGARWFPERPAQFRREPAAPERRQHRAGIPW